MYNKGERKEKIFASKAVKAEEKRERKRKKEKERNAHLPDFFKVGAYVAHRRCRHCCVTFAKGVCEQQTCGGERGTKGKKFKQKRERHIFVRRDYWLLVCMHDALYTISLSHSLSLSLTLSLTL